MQPDAIISIAILMLSVVVHEVSHGYAADRLGDPTARLAGRLSLNPLRHLDPIGSVVVPLLTFFSAGIVFGWAKPVPFNPYNLRGRWGEALVAGAGPLSNIIIALVFGLGLRFGLGPALAGGFLSDSAVSLIASIVIINIVLAVFNLVPIPPLDGSKILFSILPPRLWHVRDFLERYGMVLVILFIFFGWRFVSPIVFSIFFLITGGTA
jgi:Zn-dependent protease